MHTYLALGDSYTIGELVPPELNFPHQTTTILNASGFNIAEPVIIATTGWTTDELASAIAQKNLQHSFDIVTLLIGVNNQYRGRDLENYKMEFTELLQKAIQFAGMQPNHVFVLSIPDWGATPFAQGKDRQQIALEIDAYNAANAQIAAESQCHYLNITDSTRTNANNEIFLASDGLHPSAKEYEVWANRLAPLIRQVFN